MWARNNFFFLLFHSHFRKKSPRGSLRNIVVSQRPWLLTMTDGRYYNGIIGIMCYYY